MGEKISLSQSSFSFFKEKGDNPKEASALLMQDKTTVLGPIWSHEKS